MTESNRVMPCRLETKLFAKAIDAPTRAAAKVMFGEGKSQDTVSKLLNISNGAASIIKREDPAEYVEWIEKIRRQSVNNWLMIRERSQTVMIDRLSKDKIKNCSTADVIKMSEVAQKNELLLTGQATERSEDVIDVATPIERSARLRRLLTLRKETAGVPLLTGDKEVTNDSTDHAVQDTG